MLWLFPTNGKNVEWLKGGSRTEVYIHSLVSGLSSSLPTQLCKQITDEWLNINIYI